MILNLFLLSIPVFLALLAYAWMLIERWRIERQTDTELVSTQSYFWIEPAGCWILAAYFLIPNLLLLLYRRSSFGPKV